MLTVVGHERRTSKVLAVIVLPCADGEEVRGVHDNGGGLKEVRGADVGQHRQDAVGDLRCGRRNAARSSDRTTGGHRRHGRTRRTLTGSVQRGHHEVGDSGDRLRQRERRRQGQQTLHTGVATAGQDLHFLLASHTLRKALLDERPEVRGVGQCLIAGASQVGNLAKLRGPPRDLVGRRRERLTLAGRRGVVRPRVLAHVAHDGRLGRERREQACDDVVVEPQLHDPRNERGQDLRSSGAGEEVLTLGGGQSSGGAVGVFALHPGCALRFEVQVERERALTLLDGKLLHPVVLVVDGLGVGVAAVDGLGGVGVECGDFGAAAHALGLVVCLEGGLDFLGLGVCLADELAELGLGDGAGFHVGGLGVDFLLEV